MESDEEFRGIGQSSRRVLAFPGRCSVCGIAGREWTVYVERGSWARDHLRCMRCRAVPRERCLAVQLRKWRPQWRTLRIHESSPGRHGLSRVLAEQANGYSSSQFLDGVEPGTVVDGVRCEDLRRLSFPDHSLDILLTQDVMEHVMDPDQALSEVRRVLRPRGLHMATFPWNPNLPVSRRRAQLNTAGELEHVLEPEYHGSPVGDGRSLVTIDWGADVFARAAKAGFELSIVKMHHNRRRGIDGEHREVFIFAPR